MYFNRPFLAEALAAGSRVALFGKVERRRVGGGLQLTNPAYELLAADPDDDARIHYRPDRAGLREGRRRHVEGDAADRARGT